MLSTLSGFTVPLTMVAVLTGGTFGLIATFRRQPSLTARLAAVATIAAGVLFLAYVFTRPISCVTTACG